MTEDYTHDRYVVPGHLVDRIRAYVDDGCLPGDFLQAVLHNDFAQTVGRADDTNLANLPAFAAYMYNEVPMVCWGSVEKVQTWVDEKRKERYKPQSESSAIFREEAP